MCLISLLYKQTFDGLRFEWDEYEQNMILGCFFWGYVMTELPGGRLAEIIGGHRVFGYSMLSASVLTLLTPLAARLDYLAVVVLRVLLGLMLVMHELLHMSALRSNSGAFVCQHSFYKQHKSYGRQEYRHKDAQKAPCLYLHPIQNIHICYHNFINFHQDICPG